jgi:1,6-anhydro-N-acetylmuramate kinase
MGAHYSVNRTTSALSTTNDSLTIVCPSTRALKIKEIAISGAGTTSAYNEVAVARSTGGTTGGGGITPTPLAPLSPASGISAWTTWSAQPTLGVVIRRLAVNANGAINRVVFPPGQEIDVPPSGQVSFRSISGTGNVTIDVIYEEVG